MPVIKLDKLVPGMIVSKDVLGLNGRMILSKESQILEKHLNIFRKWGITQVVVHGEEEKITGDAEQPKEDYSKYAIPEEVPDAVVSKAVEECRLLFQLNEVNDPVVDEFFRLAVGYFVKNHPDIETFDVI